MNFLGNYLLPIIKCNQNVGPPEYETKTKGFFDMSDVMNKAAEVGVNDIGLDKTMEKRSLTACRPLRTTYHQMITVREGLGGPGFPPYF